MKKLMFGILFLSSLIGISTAQADLITGGSATFVFNNNSALFSGSGPFAPLIMERHYGTDVATATGTEVLLGIGGDPISVPPSGLVSLNANLNGASVVSPAGGRERQATNLDVDFSNVLGTWGASEQIGIDTILRNEVSGIFGGGSIGLGDYSLVNNSGTLSLVNHLGGPSTTGIAFNIGSLNVQNLGTGFSVTGNLIVGSGLSALTGGFIPIGTDVGTFSMNATAVPEPSSFALVTVASACVAWTKRRRKKRLEQLSAGEAQVA